VVRVVQAYRFALDPSPAQQAALRSHCGAQRFAFNWGLARVKANLGRREAERSYGVPEELLTPAVSWSAWRLRKDFNAVKHQVAPWWPENSKEAYASGLANLAAALANWAASRAGTRRGPKIAFPKFKGKRSVLSVRFTTGAFGLPDQDRRHVRLPRIGLVRTHESTRKLARRVDAGTARIRSVTVSYRRGRWHASFCVQADLADQVPARPADTVGVDVGIRHLAVLSSGQVIPNPRPLDKAQRDLRRLARHLADAGFGQIRRQLGYKTVWYGGRLVTADRFYPSSKTCSGCGAMKAKLRLSERMFRCERCGLVMDLDLNAARNLAALASSASSPSRVATINEPAGNPEKTRAAGTGYRHGKTIPATGDGQRPSRKARAA
jgi:transposase